ncbi:hypothetical protein ACM92Y_000646 [Cronobacter malonaticus]|uniref:DUF6950 family protein n=1 Tax=Cronobacter malonaticus TaxID=413503 RepID=UPI0011831EBD|nr:hypothetical protein [Cronobacter malonaticus]ELY6330664.1 hypothetical protein [Cronobacter malonaticus]ELY6420795.1 hypothetical protein [Cronobacter malonaticus]EMD9404577.1 hypothetical protein [Cronobacter malonaticus]EMD9421808.1 hypothetical protein [Cronobacter malonaticus]
MKNGFITEYLSGLVGEPLVYGTNDCHIMVLTVIDMITGSNCRDEIYQKYTTPTAGRKYAKENCSYSTLLLLCKDKGQIVTEPLDGDIVISSGHSTVYWRGKVIILSEDKTNYIVSQYIPNEKDKIYRFKGE